MTEELPGHFSGKTSVFFESCDVTIFLRFFLFPLFLSGQQTSAGALEVLSFDAEQVESAISKRFFFLTDSAAAPVLNCYSLLQLLFGRKQQE